MYDRSLWVNGPGIIGVLQRIRRWRCARLVRWMGMPSAAQVRRTSSKYGEAYGTMRRPGWPAWGWGVAGRVPPSVHHRPLNPSLASRRSVHGPPSSSPGPAMSTAELRLPGNGPSHCQPLHRNQIARKRFAARRMAPAPGCCLASTIVAGGVPFRPRCPTAPSGVPREGRREDGEEGGTRNVVRTE